MRSKGCGPRWGSRRAICSATGLDRRWGGVKPAPPRGAPGVDLKAPLERLKAPVLVVAGRHDRAGTIAEAEAVRDAVPGARLRILEESGSFAFAEQPVEFTKEVRNFLSGAGGGI